MSSIDRSLLAPVGVVGVVGIVSSNSLEDILVTVREAAAATRSLCSMLPRGREKNDDSAERGKEELLSMADRGLLLLILRHRVGQQDSGSKCS